MTPTRIAAFLCGAALLGAVGIIADRWLHDRRMVERFRENEGRRE